MSLITIHSPIVYISGPMTGLPELNYPAFLAAEKILEARGWIAVNPSQKSTPPDAPWATHMRADIAMMMRCGRILMLPGWEKSKGARLEHHIAQELEFTIYHLKNGEILLGDGGKA